MAFTESPATKLVPNMPFADYCKAPGVNQSGLRLFDYDLGGCPALYRHHVLHPDIETKSKALEVGRRYHHFVLEPDTFDQFYVVRTTLLEEQLFEEAKRDPKCKAKGFSTSLKVYHEWKAAREAEGKEVIRRDEAYALQEMRAALLLNNEVMDELGACKPEQLEVSAFAGFTFHRGPHEGRKMQIKARFDLNPDSDALIDLKSARAVHQRPFARQAYELGYHIQGAFYLDVANASDLHKKRFGFLAQEKEPPYLSCIHWINNWLGAGRIRYNVLMGDLATAIVRNEWPGHHSGELEPPSYAMDEIEQAA